MMAHYKLKSGVHFVSGALRGAILDTNSGKVYSVNEDAVLILKGNAKNDQYWEQLIKLGIAEQSFEATTNQFPQPLSIGLQFVWFEIISDDCNERCVHCYADSMPVAERLAKPDQPIVITKPRKSRLSYGSWLKLIEESYGLGCRKCQFIGGEPFMYKDAGKTVLDLAEYAVKLGFEYVEIFTNATLLTEEKIERIRSLGIRLAVSLYSHDAKTHDSITQTPGSHSKTVFNLRMAKSVGVKVRVSTVIMRQNQNDVEGTTSLLREIGIGTYRRDPLRPKGRGASTAISPSAEVAVKHGYKTRPNFTVSREMLAHYSTGHSCLAGKITITDTGDVIPCIFSRNHVIGNVVESMSIEEVISNEILRQIWATTKDSVMVCRDCEYRYVCFDCRPLSEAAAQGNARYLEAPYPRCTYNPYTGEWAKGVWRVDDSGRPWYDTSVEEVIVRSLKTK